MYSFAELITSSGDYLRRFNGSEYPVCFQEFEARCEPLFSALDPGALARVAEELVAALTAQLDVLPKRERKLAAERDQRLFALFLSPAAARHSETAMAFAEELQKQWNETGHVPFKEKDKIYKEYREICDKIYNGLNLSQARRRLNNFKNNLASKMEKGESSLVNERNRMMRAYENMKAEIQTYENNLGFLSSNSKKGDSLVDIMKKKVEKLRDELNLLAEKIKAVDEQIRNENKGE